MLIIHSSSIGTGAASALNLDSNENCGHSRDRRSDDRDNLQDVILS
jgi:hypothetical protein